MRKLDSNIFNENNLVKIVEKTFLNNDVVFLHVIKFGWNTFEMRLSEIELIILIKSIRI